MAGESEGKREEPASTSRRLLARARRVLLPRVFRATSSRHGESASERHKAARELPNSPASVQDPTLPRQISEISQAYIPEVSGVLRHASAVQTTGAHRRRRSKRCPSGFWHLPNGTIISFVRCTSITQRDNHLRVPTHPRSLIQFSATTHQQILPLVSEFVHREPLLALRSLF